MKKILGICTVGVFAACGSTSDNDGLGDGTITIDEFPPAYAKVNCDIARACYGEVFDLLVSGEDCQANAETGINDELPRIKAAIESGKVRYDGSKLRACFDAARARGCVDGPEPAECTAAIDGTVEVGGSCASNIECKGGETYCKSTAACPGTCTAREPAGTTCQSDSQCASNLQCSEATSRCEQPAAAGADCRGASAPDCGEGLFCIGNDQDTGVPGKCRTLADGFSVAAGGACLLNGAAFCQPSLRCTIESVDPITQNIVTRCSPPVASGASCKLSYPDVCPFNQYCAVPAQALDGTCEAKPGNAQPCAARGTDTPDISARPAPAATAAFAVRCKSSAVPARPTTSATAEPASRGGCAPAGACGVK